MTTIRAYIEKNLEALLECDRGVTDDLERRLNSRQHNVDEHSINAMIIDDAVYLLSVFVHPHHGYIVDGFYQANLLE